MIRATHRPAWFLLALALGLGATGCGGRARDDMVDVPAGPFVKGYNGRPGAPAEDDEKPAHTVTLKAYRLDRYLVTNEDYAAFVAATQHAAPKGWSDTVWRGIGFPIGKDQHPVVGVTWQDAFDFCEWMGKRLPSEAEWEKAARGTDGRLYPWGNAFDPSRANVTTTRQASEGATTPVGSYPKGASPYGAMDMAGNVWQWTNDLYRDYRTGREGPDDVRVLRGGAFSSSPELARSSYRLTSPYKMTAALPYIGFRCAADASGG